MSTQKENQAMWDTAALLGQTLKDRDQLKIQRDHLLVAVKSCLEWMEFTIPRCKNHTEVMNWGGPISKARNAIALAEANGEILGPCFDCGDTAMQLLNGRQLCGDCLENY